MGTRSVVARIFLAGVSVIVTLWVLIAGIYEPAWAEAQKQALVPSIPITAESALIMECTSGRILFEKNPDKRLPPASITKIMTMLLVMEQVSLGKVRFSDMVVTSERAMRMGGSQIWLEVGEEMSLEDLMKAIAIVSANDASVAVAEHIAGSEEAFVDMMNKRGQELGMTGTNFVNASGLPHPDHYSTAKDIALMSRALLRYPKVHEWFTTWIDYVRDGKNILVNTNRLIKSYEGVDGLKTGFTEEAGYCLAATAEKGSLRLVSVVLKVPDSTTRFNEASALLNLGFRHFAGVELAKEGQVIAEVEVTRGVVDKVDIICKDRLVGVVPRGEEDKVRHEIALPRKVDAPVAKGQKIGEMLAVTEDGSNLGRIDLIASEEVKRGNILRVIFRTTQNLLRALFKNN
ncbi:MAG: D-alanyl-D-alanine carboxypeptidase [Firmicutes bacterium]|nr:D-alanyl-D-alanine carboxypeptidase [Bacillota bacterium]